MAHNPVIWFEIYVQDIERAKAFYGAVLQVDFQQLESPGIEMWAFPSDMGPAGGPGASGTLVRMDGMPSGGNSTLVYFACNDCAVQAGRVAAAGGRVHREKTPIGEYGFIALAIDTEGNRFGLHSMQ